MTSIIDLAKKRTSVKNLITRLERIVSRHASTPISEKAVSVYQQELTALNEQLLNNHNDIIAVCTTDSDIEIQDEAFAVVKQLIFNVKVELLNIEDNYKAAARVGSTASTGSSSASNVKLPRIELPTFCGRYEDWISFQDLFKATVDRDTTISDAQKLQYLKSALSGEAARLVKAFQVTNQNYIEAWNILEERYNNEREIVASLLRRLFTQNKMTKESAPALQSLLDTTAECVRALAVLKKPVDTWDDILVYTMVEKMDPDTRRQWAITLKGTGCPTFKELCTFIEQHVRGLVAGGASLSKNQQHGKPDNDRRQASIHHSISQGNCIVCNANHEVYQCEKFKSLSELDRYNLIKKNSYCFNCLRGKHSFRQCKSTRKCKKCNKAHNTLLHQEKESSDKQLNEHQQSSNSTLSYHAGSSVSSTRVLLQTALVNVTDQLGIKHVCRVFLDQGSESSFITESCAKSLGLAREKANVSITGISSTPLGTAKGQVNLQVSSLIHNAKFEVDALILSKVTGTLPSFNCNPISWAHIKDIQLADPQFYKPGPIDILLGGDVTASIMREGIRHGPKFTPIAQNSILGWVLSGKVKTEENIIMVHHATCESDNILQRFWELEELVPTKHFTAEEKLCESQFLETYKRNSSGRFIVQIPFNNKLSKLGLSRERAIVRLKQVERRLRSQPELKQQYIQFMREYQQLNHMEPISHLELQQQIPSYYLPHHCVLREESSTTKLRVVFDGSAKSTTGISLNDCMNVGPTVQDDVFSLLLRFRLHPVALKADIAKFFRQVEVHKQHMEFQRIVWRESADQPIQDFRLKTVTYGTASAPYLATRALKQLAEDEKSKFPAACEIIDRDCYVDDLMSGATSSTSAIQLQQQLCKLLAAGGMDLRKWSSNDPIVLQSIPAELREKDESLSLDSEKSVKALGVKWNTKSDTFVFEVNPQQQFEKITKRNVLSQLAKVFDPLGWLSPVTVNAKRLFQDLWKENLGWDDLLPDSMQQKWKTYQDELLMIKRIQIPRCITAGQTTSVELHGFSDSSEKAYGASIFIRCCSADGKITSRLVTAKTKIAPLKQVSLPRLELCGAVLVAKLLISTKQALKLECPVYAWTDSTIVLGWLNSFPGRWKTFVANRVAEIQDLVPPENWNHVKSEDNPADCCSRGISAAELFNHGLWWTGPDWLASTELPTSLSPTKIQQVNLEEKKKTEFVGHISLDDSLLIKCSKLTKLRRVTAYCLRLVNNIRKPHERRIIGELSCSELQAALDYWILQVQSTTFAEELADLQKTGEIRKRSRILQLNPFVDKNGILRVGGRLQKADIPDNSKHQIILPHNHHLTKLIIENLHHKNLHAGFQLLWATLQREYWIQRARDTIRFAIRKCVICRRRRAETMQQLMGSLPKARVNPGQPFQHCGVDFAGPFKIYTVRGRGTKSHKAYFAVFVCFATKAVHLELVSDLTSEAFIAAFKRFTARRGVSSDMYSDRGTNFVGADNELKELLASTKHNTIIATYLAEKSINWHFNPAAAPHQGGLWEAGVKSVKFHLHRVIGSQIVTYEEFNTILCQVESCLNSRPLCATSADPTDYNVLTPGHFLIGKPITAIPEPDLTHLNVNRLDHWKHVQQMFQHFWRRWSAEYLSTLQQRFKWKQQRPNLQVGDLVLIKDDNLPPLKWNLGRISQVHPGADGLVRAATVKISTGEFKRPIVKLCPILYNDE